MQSDWLLTLDDGPDGGLAVMTFLTTWSLLNAADVSGLLGQVPRNISNFGKYDPAQFPPMPAPGQFWSTLGTAMICAATGGIPDHGLSGMIQVKKSLDLVLQLLNSATAAREVEKLYSWLFLQKDVNGVPLLTYLQDSSMMAEVAGTATSADYMDTLDLRAITDPAGARRQADLLLYTLKQAADLGGTGDYQNKVRSVWSSRNSKSVANLATHDSWPVTNFLAAYYVNNPLAPAVRFLANIDRTEIRTSMFYSGTRTWHAEALGKFIQDKGTAAGLTSGADWTHYDDSDCTDCGVTPSA